MDETGCFPNDCTYNTIIRGFLRKNDKSKAIELVHVMAQRGLSADSYTKSMLKDFLSADGLHPFFS